MSDARARGAAHKNAQDGGGGAAGRRARLRRWAARPRDRGEGQAAGSAGRQGARAPGPAPPALPRSLAARPHMCFCFVL